MSHMITAAESVLDVNDGCCTANVVYGSWPNRKHPKAKLTGLIKWNCPHEQDKWHIYEATLLSNHFNIIMENNQIKIRLGERLSPKAPWYWVIYSKPCYVQFKTF